ncbi:class I SAM-dependent methyltransferase [Anaeromyxobacter sp. SG66]|uniref:class I SAM-dependent methyltransferase n=1 Tax=Anaeromyxobacter sp. SG66 TaxID=2925410 RepID=UPI001F56A4DA|nr:class I SAM-dependent methyltransferase [Anaeromyxobacter sp. SG66]
MAEGPRRDFEAAYLAGTPPWDIGRPQPEIVKLAGEGEVRGTVLDVGCGTGENALHLASLGRPVVGVDGSPAAIARAREKAAARGLEVAFHVADALQLGRLRLRVETVVDCGLFHVFSDEERRPYAESLTEVLSPGGVLHILCFSDAEPPGPGPRRVAEYDLRATFRSLFAMVRIRPAVFDSLLLTGGAKAWLATFVRI